MAGHATLSASSPKNALMLYNCILFEMFLEFVGGSFCKVLFKNNKSSMKGNITRPFSKHKYLQGQT